MPESACESCVWRDVVLHRGAPLNYCANGESPRGDEIVSPADSCDQHEFHADEKLEVGRGSDNAI